MFIEHDATILTKFILNSKLLVNVHPMLSTCGDSGDKDKSCEVYKNIFKKFILCYEENNSKKLLFM
jgi:hypothetical protein